MYKILYFSVFWDFKNPTESQKTQLWYAGPVSIIQTHSKQHPYPFKRRGTNTVWILASFRPTAFRYSAQERSLFTSWYGTLHFLFLINIIGMREGQTNLKLRLDYSIGYLTLSWLPWYCSFIGQNDIVWLKVT